MLRHRLSDKIILTIRQDYGDTVVGTLKIGKETVGLLRLKVAHIARDWKPLP